MFLVQLVTKNLFKIRRLQAAAGFEFNRPSWRHMAITWQLSTFKDLTTAQLYAILTLRQQVFVVEQQCVYQDCDGQDLNAHHLLAWDHTGQRLEAVAYLRILSPRKGGDLPAIGRVVTHPDMRGKGLGKEIMTRCLRCIYELYPKAAVTLSAQQYLIDFYQQFGFRVASEGYEEDGIPHIRMICDPSV